MTSQSSPQPSRKRVASIVLGVAVTGAAVVAGGATPGSAAADQPLLPLAPPSNETIRYQVTGPGAAEYVTYALDYHQQYEPNVALPWTKQFSAPKGRVYVLSAQANGSITCTISIDGNVVSDMTATGTPARAACSH